MDKTVQVNLLFFAKSHDLAGVDECQADFPERVTYKGLLDILNTTYNLAVLENCFLIALNSDLLDRDSDEVIELKARDEIAIIPPISGG